jgi:lipopolysaccharide export system ATP-binding protein
MAAEAAVLRATGLRKRYRGRDVVHDVDLEVAAGEIVGLLGPNGAGKTTSFYMLVGLVPPDAGSIHLDGKDITRLPMHRRAHRGLGYLPQEASVFRKLTVADNVMAILQVRRDLSRRQRAERLEALLDELSIAHIRDTLGISLSGGERRRVEIARALAAEPRFILLDEPFAGIDPISIGDLRSIVYHLQERGIGILITDHNVRETLGICDRAYIISAGGVIASGSADTVLADAQVRRVYLGEDFRL